MPKSNTVPQALPIYHNSEAAMGIVVPAYLTRNSNPSHIRATVFLGNSNPSSTPASISHFGQYSRSATTNANISSTSFTSDARFFSDVSKLHEFYRTQHNAPSLIWSDALANSSMFWAQKCIWGHSHTPNVGENLAFGYADMTDSIDAWGLERTNYNWSNPGFSESTGHFTQLVWKDTKEVGCARFECRT